MRTGPRYATAYGVQNNMDIHEATEAAIRARDALMEKEIGLALKSIGTVQHSLTDNYEPVVTFCIEGRKMFTITSAFTGQGTTQEVTRHY